MRNLFNRLTTAWLVLTRPRYFVFVPTNPCLATVAEGGHISANSWASLVLYALNRERTARQAAETRLLAEMAEEAARLDAITAEINAILSAE